MVTTPSSQPLFALAPPLPLQSSWSISRLPPLRRRRPQRRWRTQRGQGRSWSWASGWRRPTGSIWGFPCGPPPHLTGCPPHWHQSWMGGTRGLDLMLLLSIQMSDMVDLGWVMMSFKTWSPLPCLNFVIIFSPSFSVSLLSPPCPLLLLSSPGDGFLLLLHHVSQLLEDWAQLHDGALNVLHGVSPALDIRVLWHTHIQTRSRWNTQSVTRERTSRKTQAGVVHGGTGYRHSNTGLPWKSSSKCVCTCSSMSWSCSGLAWESMSMATSPWLRDSSCINTELSERSTEHAVHCTAKTSYLI